MNGASINQMPELAHQKKMGTIKCSRCGFENPEISRFCNQCGIGLLVTDSQHASQPKQANATVLMVFVSIVIMIFAIIFSLESYNPLKINFMIIFFGIIFIFIIILLFKFSKYFITREEKFTKLLSTQEKLVEVLIDIRNNLDKYHDTNKIDTNFSEKVNITMKER